MFYLPLQDGQINLGIIHPATPGSAVEFYPVIHTGVPSDELINQFLNKNGPDTEHTVEFNPFNTGINCRFKDIDEYLVYLESNRFSHKLPEYLTYFYTGDINNPIPIDIGLQESDLRNVFFGKRDELTSDENEQLNFWLEKTISIALRDLTQAKMIAYLIENNSNLSTVKHLGGAMHALYLPGMLELHGIDTRIVDIENSREMIPAICTELSKQLTICAITKAVNITPTNYMENTPPHYGFNTATLLQQLNLDEIIPLLT